MSIKDGIVGAMVVGGGSGGGGGTPVVPNINATAESLPAGSEATVEKSGTNANVTFNFGIPRGADGQQGEKGDTGEQGPEGPAGQAATIQVGTVTTGAPGTNAQVTNSGTSSEAVFDFVIPRGQDGGGGGGTAGVSSFNGRTGDVSPQAGDYTAAQVGAADATTTQQALQTLSDEVDGILSGTSPVNIPPATGIKVGGIKVGEGLSATTDGTTRVAVSQEADNATGILNGALYTSIPRPSAVYPLMEVTTAPATASIQVTATKGELSVQGTTNENGKVDIELSAFGVWTFTATIDGEQATADVAVNASQLYTLNLTPYKVYGAEWDGSSSPEWSRTDDAELFQDPQPAVNNGTGSSPFDNIMPWSGMVKVEDEVAGTLVAIPKYWYKWTRNGASMKLQISNKQIDGFYVSPAHTDRGDGQGERDVVYVGRYSVNSLYKSQTGTTIYTNVSRSSYRAGIHSLGSEYWQWDYPTYCTVFMLYLVEFANWDIQGTIGLGSSGSQTTGSTDEMLYHTGTVAPTKDSYGVCQYRNLESLYDSDFNFVDGVLYNKTEMYVYNNPESYLNGFNEGVLVGNVFGQSGSVIASYEVSNEPGFEYALLAKSVSSTPRTYTCGYYSIGNISNATLLVGGASNWHNNSGIFFTYLGYSDNSGDYNMGSRSMKLPNTQGGA